jgi:hypothetical protein
MIVPRGEEGSFDPNETRELLVGTWTGIALIVDVLVRQGATPREHLIAALSDAEALARDRRRIALSALRKLIGYDFAGATSRPPCRQGSARRL